MQTLVLVSHTHWDREWYLTFEQYRTRLVATWDELLEVLEQVPEFHSFAFDGQTVPLDDYLEIRPEARDRVLRQTKAGRIHMGPLYILPDGYAPTGEAWVRAFLLGLERCAEFDADPGYVAIAEPTDLPEQFPQIVRGFGYDEAVFGRALAIDQRDGSPTNVDEAEYYWEGPASSRMLVSHMPAAYDDETGARCILHYCNAAELFWGPKYDPLRKAPLSVSPDHVDDALTRIDIVRKGLGPLATSDALLFMHGCDHLPPQRETPELIRAVNERLDDAKLVHGSYRDYLDAVRKSGRASVVRRGEARGRGGALSRLHHRRELSDALVLLERWMEPAAAIAHVENRWRRQPGYATLSNSSDLGLMRQAWKYTLQNLAHDTVWGACIDEVYDEVSVRYRKSRQIADEIAGQGLERIAERVDTDSLTGKMGASAYVVFSAMNSRKSEVFEAEFLLPPDAVGNALKVVDDAGRSWFTQVLEQRRAVRRTDRYHRMAHVEPVNAVRALVKTEDVPSTGYRAVAVRLVNAQWHSAVSTGTDADGRIWIENEHLRATVSADGTFDLTDLASGRTTEGLNRLVDQGDCGNGWRWDRLDRDVFLSPEANVGTMKVVEKGPVRAAVEAVIPWELPVGLTIDGLGRREETITCMTTVCVSLSAGARRAEVRTTIDNRARHHRLRAHFPTGITADSVQADGAFAVHERPIYTYDPNAPRSKAKGVGVHPVAPEENAMMESFVDVSDGERGFGLLTRGVPQYAVLSGEDGNVEFALTLLRAATGHVTLHDPDLTHGCQCPGIRFAEYAVYPHALNWLAGRVHTEAAGYLAPPRAVATSWHAGDARTTAAWIGELPPEIAVTSIKRSQDGDAIIVRLVNLAREDRTETVRFAHTPKAVWRADLRERAGDALALDGDGIALSFSAMEIITLRLVWP